MANFHQPPIVPISAYIVNLFHGYKPPRNDTTGLYVCLNCDRYISSANKTDWLQHTHDVHKDEFDKLKEIQRMLTNACRRIKADGDVQKTIIKASSSSSSFKLVEEEEMTSTKRNDDETAAQLLQLGEQFKTGFFKSATDYLKEAQKLMGQAKQETGGH